MRSTLQQPCKTLKPAIAAALEQYHRVGPTLISKVLDKLVCGTIERRATCKERSVKRDILTHAFHGGQGNAAEDGFESMKAAQARGVIIDVGMAGHVHTDFDVMKRAIQHGVVPNTISTDITKMSAYTRGGRYGMTTCMSIARTLGLGEEEIFRAVTSRSAKALGKEDEWGYLKVGRCADIAVLDYANEVFDLTDKAGNRIFTTEGYRCVLTVSDGQVVFRD